MRKKFIWDTGALSLFFMDHGKAKSIMQDIVNSKIQGFVPLIVISEFYYKTWQKFGKQAAEVRTISILDILEEISIQSDDKFDVGELKIKNPELSIVDAIILTLSDRYKGTLLTTDTPITEVKGYKTMKLIY